MGIGIIVYVAIFFLIGIGTYWLVRGSGKRYIVCGKSLPLLVVGTALTAQSIDGNGTMGNSSLVYDAGFWAGFVIPLGLAACLFVTGIFFARPLNRMNLLTLPDFYFRRYGTATEMMASVFMGISFVILVAGNLAGAAWIVSVVFNVDYLMALVMVSAIILAYTLAGGLFASVATNFIQIYPAIIGFLGGAGWLLATFGWDFFAQAIPAGFLDFSGMTSPDNGAYINWASFLALALGDVVALDFMERIFAAKSPETAQRGCYFAGVLTLIAGLPCSFIGLMGLGLFPNIADPRMVLPNIAITTVPFVFGLLILTGVIGAAASTASGGLLSVSTVLGRNIIQRHIVRKWAQMRAVRQIASSQSSVPNRAISDHQLLIITRFMAIPVVLLGFWLAWVKPEPGVMLILAFDVVLAGCFIPLAGGMFWQKANAAGAVASIIVGSLLRALLYIAIPKQYAGLDTMIPPAIALLVFVLVSLITQKKYPPKHEVIQEIPSDEDVISGVS